VNLFLCPYNKHKNCSEHVEDLPQGTSRNLPSPSTENHACFIIRRTRVQISFLRPDILTKNQTH